MYFVENNFVNISCKFICELLINVVTIYLVKLCRI